MLSLNTGCIMLWGQKLLLLLFSLNIFLGNGFINAQDSTIINFFPYSEGDFWVYSEFSEVKQSIVNEVKYTVYADSTDSLGNKYAFVSINNNNGLRFISYRKDTLGNIFTNFETEELKVLKQSVTQEMDFWVGGKISDDEYAMLTLLERSTYFFEGENREERNIGLSISNDTTEAFGFGTSGQIWLEGFGNTEQFSAEGGNSLSMKGAYKNGVAFGDTTFSEILVDTVRTNFFPYSNGDVWVYDVTQVSTAVVIKQVRYRAIADSTDSHENQWVIAEKNNNGAKDTVYYRLELNGDIYSDDFIGVDALKFKEGAVQKEEFWVGPRLSETKYAVYQMRGIGVANPFFNSQEVYEDRSIDFYSTQDTTANFKCCGERTFQEVWVANFGVWLYRDHYLPDHDERWQLVGVYKEGLVFGDTTFTIVTPNELEIEVPAAFIVYQNYPNPFNPYTTITFSLPVDGHVELVVFDVLGRKVSELVNEFRTQGSHTITFDASSLSSGIYLYQLTVGSEITTKQMTLIK